MDDLGDIKPVYIDISAGLHRTARSQASSMGIPVRVAYTEAITKWLADHSPVRNSEQAAATPSPGQEAAVYSGLSPEQRELLNDFADALRAPVSDQRDLLLFAIERWRKANPREATRAHEGSPGKSTQNRRKAV